MAHWGLPHSSCVEREMVRETENGNLLEIDRERGDKRERGSEKETKGRESE